MPLTLDHVFICCSKGAPEAEALLKPGLVEGSSNVHVGQGTANRRFFFENAYLELLWVHDEAEARSKQTECTRLWERWSLRNTGACPFGIIFRSIGSELPLPFNIWHYMPSYLPPGLSIEFAEGTPLSEPELAHLPFVRRDAPPAGEPIRHHVPVHKISGVTVGLLAHAALSRAASALHSSGLVRFMPGSEYSLELSFPACEPAVFDLRPALPLVLRGDTRE